MPTTTPIWVPSPPEDQPADSDEVGTAYADTLTPVRCGNRSLITKQLRFGRVGAGLSGEYRDALYDHSGQGERVVPAETTWQSPPGK